MHCVGSSGLMQPFFFIIIRVYVLNNFFSFQQNWSFLRNIGRYFCYFGMSWKWSSCLLHWFSILKIIKDDTSLVNKLLRNGQMIQFNEFLSFRSACITSIEKRYDQQIPPNVYTNLHHPKITSRFNATSKIQM